MRRARVSVTKSRKFQQAGDATHPGPMTMRALPPHGYRNGRAGLQPLRRGPCARQYLPCLSGSCLKRASYEEEKDRLLFSARIHVLRVAVLQVKGCRRSKECRLPETWHVPSVLRFNEHAVDFADHIFGLLDERISGLLSFCVTGMRSGMIFMRAATSSTHFLQPPLLR